MTMSCLELPKIVNRVIIQTSDEVAIQDSKFELFDPLGHGVHHLLLHRLPSRYGLLHRDSKLSHVKHHFILKEVLQSHQDRLSRTTELFRSLVVNIL